MTPPHRLYVGTIGEGIFRSLDGGQVFRRACEGMFVECDVRALAVHPADPRTVYMGSELGVFVTTDGADSWMRLAAPVQGRQVWSLWVDPRRPELILAGTCPSGILRSDDGGRSWAEASTRMRRECPRIVHTRVTTIVADLRDSSRLWAGVEIDGIHRSLDGGRNWEPVGTGLSSQDIHTLAPIPGGRGGALRCLLAATNNDLNRSTDEGVTWQPLDIGRVLPWSYCRALAQVIGRPGEVLLGIGDGPPGSAGVAARSHDGGETWAVAKMPAQANSTVWCFGAHPADPLLVYAASVSGELYRSTDGGANWGKLHREFGEVRAVAWAPEPEA
jgi:photosystem II stability/assembly factor-like uncharacterized protein